MITTHAKHESQVAIGQSHKARTIEKVPSTAPAVENFARAASVAERPDWPIITGNLEFSPRVCTLTLHTRSSRYLIQGLASLVTRTAD
jgi:hypothetical protein